MSSGRRIEVNGLQVLASVLAAVTGAIAASYLGIAGTIIGAAIMSVASTLGAAVYKHFLGRGQERIRSAAQDIVPLARERAAAAGLRQPRRPLAAEPPRTEPLATQHLAPEPLTTEPLATPDGPRPGRAAADSSRRRWLMRGAAAGTVFVIAMGGITAFEAATGKPLDATVWHRQGSGTTVQNLVGSGRPGSHPAPRPGGSKHPGPSRHPARPSATPTPSPTVKGTHSPTPSPSPSPTSTGSASPSPTATRSRSPAAAAS